MQKWMTAFLLFLCAFPLSRAHAQTVDEVISKYETAMGGREKLASLQSVYMEGVSVMQNGNEITSKTTRENGKLMRSEISFGMGSFTILVTDKAGWASNPRSGGKFEAMGAEGLKSLQADLDLSSPLSNYAAKGHKAELLGREDVNGVSCYKIKLTTQSGVELTYFIDPTTYYIIREQRKGGMMGRRAGTPGAPAAPASDAPASTDYSDFQKTPEGYVFPFSIKRGGMGGSTIIEKLEVNQPVDQKLYKAE